MSVRSLEREQLAEISMVDLIYSLLKEGPKEPRSFQSLLEEAGSLKGLSAEQIKELTVRIYTDINIDGRFKSLGNNMWGLKSWYPVEQAEEIVISDVRKRLKRKKKVDDEFDEYDDELLLDDDDELLDDEALLDEEDDLDEYEDDEDLDEDLDEESYEDLDDLDLDDDALLDDDDEILD